MSDRISRDRWRIKAASLAIALLSVPGCGGEPIQTQPATSGSKSSPLPNVESQNDQQPKFEAVNPPQIQQNANARNLGESLTSPAPANGAAQSAEFRASDDRPVHDTQSLKKRGIERFESKRCVLLSDIDPEIAKTLPPFIDELYTELVKYFGELPPNREGTDFQVTGYLMRDQKVFKDAGLLPETLPSFEHGRHSGYEFWLNEQKWDYYRRHLMLHEATHCFMTCCIENRNLAPPSWYMEGMAEWFATHRVGNGKIQTAVMQDTDDGFDGFNRVRIVRDAVKGGVVLSLDRLRALEPGEFIETEHYAQGWAICQLMNRNPNYKTRFRKLGQIRSYSEFTTQMSKAFVADYSNLKSEAGLLLRELEVGHDFERTAIQFGRQAVELEESKTLQLVADAGWQTTGVLVNKGKPYQFTATGFAVLAKQPKPWMSDPNGVTIRYCEGQPMGQLQAIVLDHSAQRFGEVIPVGDSAVIEPKATGTLFLRVNDFASERSDNSGGYSVALNRVKQ